MLVLSFVSLILCACEVSAATCGDGLQEEEEQCEDGNQIDSKDGHPDTLPDGHRERLPYMAGGLASARVMRLHAGVLIPFHAQIAGDGCSEICQCETDPCDFAASPSVNLASVVLALRPGVQARSFRSVLSSTSPARNIGQRRRSLLMIHQGAHFLHRHSSCGYRSFLCFCSRFPLPWAETSAILCSARAIELSPAASVQAGSCLNCACVPSHARPHSMACSVYARVQSYMTRACVFLCTCVYAGVQERLKAATEFFHEGPTGVG